MNETLPRPSVTPSSIVVTSPGRTVTTSLDVVNRGGGTLKGTVESDVPWVTVDPNVIEDNHIRIAVTVDVSAIADDTSESATLTMRFDKMTLEIPVAVTRAGFARALREYREEHLAEARDIARSVAHTSLGADAALLIAMTYLDEKNAAAAARPLLDAADAEPDASFPPDLFRHLIEVLKPALTELREARFALPLLDRLTSDGTAQRMGAEAETAGLLREAAERFVQEFPPDVLPPADLKASTVLVERLKARFPDDARWERWLADASALQVESKEDRRTQSRAQMWITLVVSAILVAAGLLFMLPYYWVHQAGTMLASGQYEKAMSALQRAATFGFEPGGTRELRDRINFAWAKAMFASGDEKEALLHLGQAVRDAPGNSEIAEFRRKAYLQWAETLLRRGQIRDGFEVLQVSARLNLSDRSLPKRVASLRDLWEVYVNLSDIAAGPSSGKSPAEASTMPVDLEHVAEARGWGDFLSAHRIVWYDRRIQVLFVDLWGNNHQQVAIAGNDRSGRSGLSIYIPVNRSLKAVLTVPAGKGETLDRMQQINFRPEGRPALLVNWLDGSTPTLGHGVLVWGDAQGLHRWAPPRSVSTIEARDPDRSGHLELWTKILVGQRTQMDTAVLLPVPYGWTDHGPRSIARDESQFYDESVIPQLKTEMQSNPFADSDPKRAAYLENRKKALDVVGQMLKH